MVFRVPPLLCAALLSVLPTTALADSIVLAPLVSRNAETSASVSSLMSAELDFQPSVDRVVEIDQSPSSTSCLASTSCLKGLLAAGGGEQLITGAVSSTSAVHTLDLVYYDGESGRILRRQTFELPATPMGLADGMTGVIRELLTGKTKAEETAEEDAVASYEFEVEGDDFSFEAAPKPPSRAEEERRRRAAEEEARRRLAEEEARRAEEERRRLAEERRREEEAARRRAEEEERRRLEAQAKLEADRRREEGEQRTAALDEFDPSLIQFGSASDEIRVESAEDIQFEDGGLAFADEEEVAFVDLDEDLDAPPTRSDRSRRREHSPRPTAARPEIEREGSGHAIQITARGGYSRYYQLGFITYGAELALPIAGTGLHVIGGVEAYSVNRTLPAELQEQVGRATAWDTIIPFNAGLVYKIGTGPVVPYVGADAIVTRYLQDPNAFSVGGRGRLGLDVMITRAFGINANVGLGAWHGTRWGAVDTGMQNTGFLPQASAGTIFSF